MSGNVEVSIKIEFKPTDAPPSVSEEEPTQIGDGQFQLVIDGKKSLDIDALEQGLLWTTFPALRSALSSHLQREGKKNRAEASFAS
jgi:hypothetical protein